MTLSNDDFVMISTLLSSEMGKYNKKLVYLEKTLKKILKRKKVDDSWMSYDELAKNIVVLSGDEYYRDFNIVRMTE